ncbi:pheophorbide a oxygenase [Monoraphidium neglectum]|uniref:Pheophorbide a oxygenase n=1 Tax=Monoraphidium neglectum TaxID=145388 RepID=A0A0D2KDT7_9CHLO|nr:pheophorbide a oxygenase [Monoraphidium neglectum]KIY93998.1 pheophorbide a oxygenase [Monoraphidium neglectum]|eukprot:XP_013893018.1 pheophorbide a oxygenase [Monoraphidium neglectum]
MAIVGDLDRARPTAVKLLGRRLVLWYDSAASRWTAMEDRCPHRLAPLSEGRIEPSTGHLMCSYHGWQFDGSGTCTAIPQIRDPRAKASAMGSKRSCVTSYPVKEEQGLLWVWADPASKEAAESAPTSAVPEGRDPEGWTPRTGG